MVGSRILLFGGTNAQVHFDSLISVSLDFGRQLGSLADSLHGFSKPSGGKASLRCCHVLNYLLIAVIYELMGTLSTPRDDMGQPKYKELQDSFLIHSHCCCRMLAPFRLHERVKYLTMRGEV